MIRSRWFTIAMGLGVMLRLSTAFAGTSVVYPTGVWPDDVNNVQAAVSTDGMVLLKAVNRAGKPTAFNFGTPEYLAGRKVLIEANVNIQGETIRGSRTTIQGGLDPFRGYTPVSRRISGVDFVGPLDGAIEILATAGTLEISNNRISGIVPSTFGGNFSETEGVFISGYGTTDVTGSIQIWNNRIDLSDSTATFRFGLQLDTVYADVNILGNQVLIGQSPVNGRMIDSEAIAAVRCHGKVTISFNSVRLGENEVYVGIGAYGDADASYTVAGNIVTNDAPMADGIRFNGKSSISTGFTGGLIEDNVVSMHNSNAAISLYGLVSGVTVRDNFIVGDSASFGLIISNFFDADVEANNQLIDNAFEFFNAGIASIYLDTNTQNTTVRGTCGTVIDLGKGNHVSCRNAN
jgi:hypothetical protein